MPFLYLNRSRRLFTAAPPTESVIPTTDSAAYEIFPGFRWVYNKLTIAELQGIACGPHGTQPPLDMYPIFSKPIYNLGGMAANARHIATPTDYLHSLTPGHMWSACLQGEHYSTDIAVVQGQAIWLSHTRGLPGPKQTWDYWEVNVSAPSDLNQTITTFIETYLKTYTGMLNMETIGNKIIEVHLRFSPQWPDLYGEQFLPSLVALYSAGEWEAQCRGLQTGYSVVLFDEEKYARVSTTVSDAYLEEMERHCGVRSITMRYDAEQPFRSVMKPLGGCRIAWINGFDLNKCLLAREKLRDFLHSLYKSASFTGST
ncbi:hypothetical protein ATEIFO6365_0011000100 [Aspergillus terreus]|uniref:Uncharacterized protein n=1 Tax=Aspergillus terreus TaxID=33178 RepID=A0A5M3Z1X8_ASPTE|nr:hypothetical protein ATETN484_0006000100 [Aspergillus terreus]GFF19742.1 hypothetical protein ATEIFO6365_0011000100 [Aspergillus terreus]